MKKQKKSDRKTQSRSRSKNKKNVFDLQRSLSRGQRGKSKSSNGENMKIMKKRNLSNKSSWKSPS